MSKLKILAIASDTHGVGKFRILDPYKYIGENHNSDIHVDLAFDIPDEDSFFKDYNIVVFHSFIHKTSHEINLKRLNFLKNQGIITIMDIDDFWNVDQKHPMYHQVRESKTPEKKVQLLKSVDYVSTTTPIFAKTIKDKLGLKNVVVFPNAINEEEDQFKINKIPSEKIRFGWLGGSSHLFDIELLEQGISSVYATYKDKVQFVLCGFDTRGTVTEFIKGSTEVRQRPIEPLETVWFKYESIFTDKFKVLDDEYKKYLFTFLNVLYDDKNKPYIRRWTKDISSYATNYNYFDVSLAPLVENLFNTNKSQLKAIESGFHKKALIASETNPYTLDLVNAFENGKFISNGNALLVNPKKNHKQWAQHMKRLVENPSFIEDLGERLYETVKDKYSLKKVCKDRVEFFKSIIKK
jgi:glycosyltransferase involved in cell wall biosynthesis